MPLESALTLLFHVFESDYLGFSKLLNVLVSFSTSCYLAMSLRYAYLVKLALCVGFTLNNVSFHKKLTPWYLYSRIN